MKTLFFFFPNLVKESLKGNFSQWIDFELGMQKTELVYFVVFKSFLLTWSDCEINRLRLLLRYIIIYILSKLLKNIY